MQTITALGGDQFELKSTVLRWGNKSVTIADADIEYVEELIVGGCLFRLRDDYFPIRNCHCNCHNHDYAYK
jgi:hypothetical protein